MASESPVVAATRSSMTLGCVEEVCLAGLLQVVEADDPVAVGGAVEHDDLADRGQLGVLLTELGDLLVVLGEHDAAVGVGQDVGDVVGHRARVDRGRCGAGGVDREVGEDPLDAGAGGDRDALLGLDAERDEARGEVGHAYAGLGPGQRVPLLVLVGVAVGLVVAGFLDAVVEHLADAASAILDDLKLFGGDNGSTHENPSSRAYWGHVVRITLTYPQVTC